MSGLQLGNLQTAKMIPKTWGKDFCCSKFSVERRTSEQPSPIHLGPAVLLPDIYFSRSEAAFHMMHHPSRSLGCEAKRSRVESIIKGMSGSPGVSNANPQEVRQGDTSMTLSLYENQMGQLEMYQPPDQNQVCMQNEGKNEDVNNKTVEETLRRTSQTLSGDLYCDDFMFHNGKPLNYTQLKADKVKLMKDVLKCELSKALSTSVDTIFKTKTKQDTREPPSHLFYFSNHQTSARPTPGTQTEAMSLVVRNDKLHPLSPPKHGDGPERPKPHRGRGPEKGPQQTADWASGAFKVKSKVNSGEERRSYPVGHEVLKSLPLSRVRQSRGESSSFNNIYTINEGLTTNHLKKAKLMFFYTRYPSSFVLKMCFGDVQFTRCITSQLIKWFSNFREFFYIQMEKFARHAVLRGAAGDGALAVGRESELFRVLNLHYNKTSDFQVPERFLEVAEITLREFYIAICLGRDQDPSWKKGIYRVISKLDSDVPTNFILT